MTTRHRFVVLCQGLPCHTATDLTGVVVVDSERQVPVDTPDLLAWRQVYWPEEEDG